MADEKQDAPRPFDVKTVEYLLRLMAAHELSEIDLKEGDQRHKHPRRTWKIELESTRMIDVVTVRFTVEPGGHSGWHTHPGPALFTVSAGTLTMYEADDPSCTPELFPAGTGSIEAGSSRHNHLLRNETSEIAETMRMATTGVRNRSDRRPKTARGSTRSRPIA